MHLSVAGVIATLYALQAAPPPNPPAPQPPIEQTEAPEDQATRRPAESIALPALPASVASPAAGKPTKWDVNAPPGAIVRQVPIDVDEGSWIDLDVSPDGRTIAFTVLGDIYTMPIQGAIVGGTPRRIAAGLAWEVQPRFSPDGRRIAFTSDRGGGDNIWLMNVDGSDKRQVTKEDFRLLNQPSWSKDGRFIAARKHFTTGRSLGTGEIWLYSVAGGTGVQLVKRASEKFQKELGEPAYAGDGKSIFYTRNITPGATFEYAQDSNTELFDIERYDLETAEVTTAVSGLGGSVRPTPSPDGRTIAFVRRERARSKLYVRDLASGAERKIYDALDQDVQETWAVTGVYPNMAWTPDSRSVIFWAGGKIRRVDADGTNAAVIPFRLRDTRGTIDAPHPQIAVSPDRFETRMPRFATVSPDGRTIVFETLGKLWVKRVAGGPPRRLTSDGEALELFPAWSRDGRTIAYIAWTDTGLGRIMAMGAAGGRARVVTARPGHYARPAFSPDGRTIAFESRASEGLTSPLWSVDPGIYRVASAGGTSVLVARDASEPQFAGSSDRLFMIAREEDKRILVSTDLSGGRRRIHAKGEMVTDYSVAPDGGALAFRQNYQAFAIPLLPGAQAIEIDAGSKALPITRVSGDGADAIGWSSNGARLHWTLGPTLFSADRAALFTDAPAADGASKFVAPRTGVSLAMEFAAAKPGGTIALVGARVLTMQGDGAGAIDDGVIVVRGDRIVAVGARATTPVPAGARTIDVAGRTIIPGLVDAHAHGPQGEDDLVPQQNWSAIANLALGTTTIHDPSNRASEVFAAAERQRAGQLLAPRIFSTAEVVYGAKAPGIYAEINSYEDALAHVRRIKAQGGRSIKNYNQPRRDQRQQVVAAARAEGMQVVAEGGSLFGQDMTIAADGNSTLEHNIPLSVFYDDVVQFFSQTHTNYTPTLIVSFGGLAGDPYWRQASDVLAQPLLRAHIPPDQLAAANARRVTAPEADFIDDDNAREAHKLARKGTLVSIGAHGQQAGIGPHWELWSFVRGGMTPTEALRAGTIVPATSLGMAADIGSLEPGKLADLVVLAADPAADIRNSEKVVQVMLGGRLYDAATMDEIAPGSTRRAPYFWRTGVTAASAATAGHAAD